jgi:acetolactate synthase-1/2/3 large subunit
MPDITGGELLARCLATENIRFVFGLPCPEIDPLLAALEGHQIRFVPVRHESAGAHMAEGVYKTTGAASVVLGNPGPGSANLLPGFTRSNDPFRCHTEVPHPPEAPPCLISPAAN